MAALESLACQKLTNAIELEVIVVDNDLQGSAAHVLQLFRSRHPTMHVVYAHEKSAGVSFARNRCLREASGKWLAFLDDDEQAATHWLRNLYRVARTCDADAVFGPVLPSYPAGVPDWIVSGRVHERPRFETGARVGWKDARTGNVLMKSTLARSIGGFDIRFSKTGGEDSFFFACAERAGASLTWCDDAEVIESIPMERTTRRWVMQRAFYGGRTFARLNAALFGRFAYIKWMLHGLVSLFLLIGPAVLMRLFHRRNETKYMRKLAGALGKIVAPFYTHGVYGQE